MKPMGLGIGSQLPLHRAVETGGECLLRREGVHSCGKTQAVPLHVLRFT